MLTVNLICIGRLKEKYWRDACEEYEKRLGAFCKFSIVELPESRIPDQPSQASILGALGEEGEKILSRCKSGVIIPLCIEGEEISSQGLAQKIQQFSVNGISSLSFVIGSSYGLADKVKQAGAFRLSMSPMTFPHQLARVMVCEQIYRAFQLINHGKYHK